MTTLGWCHNIAQIGGTHQSALETIYNRLKTTIEIVPTTTPDRRYRRRSVCINDLVTMDCCAPVGTFETIITEWAEAHPEAEIYYTAVYPEDWIVIDHAWCGGYYTVQEHNFGDLDGCYGLSRGWYEWGNPEHRIP